MAVTINHPLTASTVVLAATDKYEASGVASFANGSTNVRGWLIKEEDPTTFIEGTASAFNDPFWNVVFDGIEAGKMYTLLVTANASAADGSDAEVNITFNAMQSGPPPRARRGRDS